MIQPTKLQYRLHLGSSAPFSRGPHWRDFDSFLLRR